MQLDKFNTLFCGPVFNRSGYGCFSDCIAPAIINHPRFNTLINPLPFGTNPSRQYRTNYDDLIKSRLLTQKMPPPQILIAHDLPYRAQPAGLLGNIIISAMAEFNPLRPQMIEACNRWDLVLATSEFTKRIILDSSPKMIRPIDILHQPVDSKIFNPNAKSQKIDDLLKRVNNAYLTVGQWASGDVGKDRKNLPNLIKYFCDAFQGRKESPTLIIKASGCHQSPRDRNTLLELITNLKTANVDIKLLHGELTQSEMASLYCHPKILALISATRGEGYGIPMLEASMCNLPIIAPRYSGYLDFLEDKFIALDGKMEECGYENEFVQKFSKWYEVDRDALITTLRDYYYQGNAKHNKQVMELGEINRLKFNFDSFQNGFHKILDKFIS